MREEDLIIEDGEEVVILLEDEEMETSYIDTDLINEELSQDVTVSEEVMVPEEEQIEYDDEDDETSFLGGIGSKIIIGMGVLVAVLAIVVGVFLLKNRVGKNEQVDFSTVGNEVALLGTIGGDNIEAITTAQGERLEELYEAVKSYDYDEADEETGITTIQLTLTSIVKDLKIKCVNKKDKLIANVPFQIEITDPNGKSYTVTDDDKDGIVYLKDIEGGNYKVKLIKLEGYDTMYDFETVGMQSVSVKSQLDYKKVDVSNEIKKATDAVSAKEDTKISETAIESKLTDTVGYVMSSKTLISDGYTQIDKASKVTDPLQTLKKQYESAMASSRFYRLAENNQPDPTPGEGNEEDENNNSHEHDYTIVKPVDSTHHAKFCNGEGCDGHDAEVQCNFVITSVGNGTHVGKCSECGNTQTPTSCDLATGTCPVCGFVSNHKHEYTYDKLPTPGKHTAVCKNADGLCTAINITEDCTYENGSSECKYCKAKKAVSFKIKAVDITGDKSIVYVKDGTKTYTYKVAASFEEGKPAKTDYKWEIVQDGTIISVADNIVNKDTVSIKPMANGKAKLKCTLTFTLEDNTETTSVQTYDIEVTSGEIVLSHTGKKLIFINGDEITVTASLGNNSKDKLKWTTSDASAASVVVSDDTKSAKIKAQPGKAGVSFIITVSYENNTAVNKQVTFTVMNNPKEDKATKLVDNEGKQLYVYDSSSKKYREAVYADYYTADKLYVAGGTGGGETYKYTGWWKLDGKTYYFDANGKKVTGDQVINGAKYSFGSDGALKSGTGTFGIDVSVWNGTIDWTKVSKSGVNYAIIRCGFRGSSLGGLYEDSKFAQNISNATKAGIKVGVYFFTQAVTEAEAVEEASMCISLVNGYNLAYPIFVDVESSGGRADGLTKDQRTAIVNAFCKTVANSGYKAGVYANKNWFETKINASQLTGYTIWLAQYASKATYSSTRYDLWQYSSKGSISGISGDVDLNLSYVGY